MAPRNYLKDLTVSFKGLPLEMIGNLVNVTVTGADKAEAFVTVTPEGMPLRKVKQLYFDPETNAGPWNRAECRQAKELDGGELAVVDPEEIKAAKKSELPERILELEVFDREEVEAYLCPGKTRYVFAPGGSASLYGIIQEFLINNPNLVLIGKVNLGSRANEKIMHVRIGVSGHLMVEELVYPEDVVDFERAAWPEVKRNVYEMSEAIIRESISTFDPDEWQKTSRVRLSSLVNASRGVEPAPSLEKKSNPEVDLEALLAATLAQVRERKESVE